MISNSDFQNFTIFCINVNPYSRKRSRRGNLSFFFYRLELKKLDEELKRCDKNSIQLKFTLVPARAGIRGNEEADKLAKEGAVKFARVQSGVDNSNIDENQRYFSYFNTGVIAVCLSSILIWHLLRKRGNI